MISIIIPFHNEAENIPILLKEMKEVMEKNSIAYEVVLVDDGSAQSIEPDIHMSAATYVHHHKRLGKGEALKTGLKNAQGDMIIFMDGDLQDDPNDIPVLLQKLKEGYDLVNGIRTKRKDTGIIKLYSAFANKLLRAAFKSPFTDINCGFKIFRREVLDEMPLYGNNFRFLPLSAYYRGYKVSETPVHNRKRIHGISKFGATKLFVGLLDMTTAYFVFKFAERPLHFFGTIGSSMLALGMVINTYLAAERIFFHVLLYRRPVLWLGILLMIIGVQILMTGLIGELIVYLHKKK
jgi:glycosyltransferase involved in cell wall biosynthesis